MKTLLCLLLFIAAQSTREKLSTPTATGGPLNEPLNGNGNEPCPPLQVNTTGRCKCSSERIHDTVICQDDPYQVSLRECYCMTYSPEMNQLHVGSCQYNCHRIAGYGFWIHIPVNTTSQINEFMCGIYNRQGQLCGSCVSGHAPPVYSYYLSCVNCTTSNWGKYMAVSLLPVTAFFIFVIIFRISATHPKLNGFILCIQIFMCPANMRMIEKQVHSDKVTVTQRPIIKAVASFFGIWNLNFIRLVYTPFCLQPHTNTLQVIALDYIIAVYPLLLIVLSYLLVTLYDRNVKIIVWLWKPFVPLFIRFRRQWNIRSSLVDAFATFLLLSYVKILSVSVDLLMPVLVYDQNGHRISQLYLFNQGDVAFFGSHHLPYACLALFFLLTFTLLPMLLLFLYPSSCFQIYLNRTGCRCQSLHIFMDTFQGHYKDGTNGTRDLRFFSGLYLLLRVVVYTSTVVTYQITSYAYTTNVIAVAAISVALAQPYKNYYYNFIDASLLILLNMLCATLLPIVFYHPHTTEIFLTPMYVVIILLFLIYIIVQFFYWLRFWRFLSHCWYRLHCKMRGDRQGLNRNMRDYNHITEAPQ